MWTLAVLHGLISGTDTATPWGVGLYIACISTVAFLTAARLLEPAGGGSLTRRSEMS